MSQTATWKQERILLTRTASVFKVCFAARRERIGWRYVRILRQCAGESRSVFFLLLLKFGIDVVQSNQKKSWKGYSGTTRP
jgi:hypothetical protein